MPLKPKSTTQTKRKLTQAQLRQLEQIKKQLELNKKRQLLKKQLLAKNKILEQRNKRIVTTSNKVNKETIKRKKERIQELRKQTEKYTSEINQLLDKWGWEYEEQIRNIVIVGLKNKAYITPIFNELLENTNQLKNWKKEFLTISLEMLDNSIPVVPFINFLKNNSTKLEKWKKEITHICLKFVKDYSSPIPFLEMFCKELPRLKNFEKEILNFSLELFPFTTTNDIFLHLIPLFSQIPDKWKKDALKTGSFILKNTNFSYHANISNLFVFLKTNNPNLEPYKKKILKILPDYILKGKIDIISKLYYILKRRIKDIKKNNISFNQLLELSIKSQNKDIRFRDLLESGMFSKVELTSSVIDFIIRLIDNNLFSITRYNFLLIYRFLREIYPKMSEKERTKFITKLKEAEKNNFSYLRTEQIFSSSVYDKEIIIKKRISALTKGDYTNLDIEPKTITRNIGLNNLRAWQKLKDLSVEEIVSYKKDKNLPENQIYVTSKIEGINLKSFLEQTKGKYASSLFRQAVDLISSMWVRGVFHNHLHAGNFVVRMEKGQPKLVLIDFNEATSFQSKTLDDLRKHLSQKEIYNFNLSRFGFASETLKSIEIYFKRERDTYLFKHKKHKAFFGNLNIEEILLRETEKKFKKNKEKLKAN